MVFAHCRHAREPRKRKSLIQVRADATGALSNRDAALVHIAASSVSTLAAFDLRVGLTASAELSTSDCSARVPCGPDAAVQLRAVGKMSLTMMVSIEAANVVGSISAVMPRHSVVVITTRSSEGTTYTN
jgi:hypothetical protein